MFEENTIYNMNCMYGLPFIDDSSIDLILTDIPYGNVTRNGEERARYGGQLRSMDKGGADLETFNLYEFLEHCYRVTSGSIYIFCGIEQMSEIFAYFDAKEDMTARQCLWHKTNPSPVNGQHYWIHSVENCVFAKKRRTTFNRHCQHNVWNFPVGRSKRHPTEKPLKLFEYLIESSTNEGDIILDPCIGSGTTAEAAVRLNRKFIGFEIDDNYFNVATERIKALEV